MSYTRIAKAEPFEGKPRLQMPAFYGASPNKPILYRIPVLGQRPVTVHVENLPEGMQLIDRNVLTGTLPEGDYRISVIAENELGFDRKEICFEIHPDHLLLTPLMGFTSWNAFLQQVTQKDMERTADLMDSTGLAEYGYSYVNLDSAWQKEYGGEFDAIMPNEKFPDMKAMVERIHSYGFKAGIYSAPMRNALGKPRHVASIPGCTRGELDDRFSKSLFGIGVERMERNNVLQWTQWGFDYLKYDWRPTDAINADIMKKELLKSERDFGYCVTVACTIDLADYWKKNCNSWRGNRDSEDKWPRLLEIFDTYDPWIPHIGKGHFFDLDMLEVGNSAMNVLEWQDRGRLDITDGPCRLTEDEQLLAYTMRAFFLSPIQISSRLEKMSEFEKNMYCNEEMIAIHQDSLVAPAFLKLEKKEGSSRLKIYEKPLADGSYAQAFFNIGETWETVALDKGVSAVRDVWAKEMLREQIVSLPPHSVRVIRYER